MARHSRSIRDFGKRAPDEWSEAGRGLKHYRRTLDVSARGSSPYFLRVDGMVTLGIYVFNPDDSAGRFLIFSLGAAF
jgi:hypothetical protein